MEDSRALAHRFLALWADSDVDGFTTLLAPDITFESPMASLRGRHDVAAAMSDFAALVTGIEILASAADGDDVLVLYDMHTRPYGTIRAAECYRFRDGLIAEDRLVFDSSPMRRPAGEETP